MSGFYTDNDDLRFYVERQIDWAPLVELTEFFHKAEGSPSTADEAVEFYRGVPEMIGEFSAAEIAPHAARIDREHPTLANGDVVTPAFRAGIFERMKGVELHGMCVPRELGGMNCPFLVFLLGSELLARADVSVAAHNGFHAGIAMALLLFSTSEGTTEFDRDRVCITKTRFAEAIGEILRGEAWGSMDITEPGAGSDMAALRTRGEQDADGNWFVTGEKIFITSGHGKYHFVIARTEEAQEGGDAFAGLKGLSMFLVPTYATDAAGRKTFHADFARLEEKLGHHGSATVGISSTGRPRSSSAAAARGSGTCCSS